MPIILNGTTGITTPGITNTGPFVFQGVVELTAGTVSAPSLTTTGDTNTGIYFPAADQVAITTGGTQRVFVSASGDVGIGTGSPDQKLAVSGQQRILSASPTFTSSGKGLELFFNSGDDTGYLQSYDRGGGGAYKALTVRALQVNFTSGTGGASTLLFDSSGNLGLGVTPDGNNLAKTFELQQGFTMFGFSNTSYLSANAYYNSGWKYKSTAAAAYYEMSGANGHQWSVASSGTAGNAITFTTALTLNANGNLVLQGGNTAANGVGVTFPATQSASTNANTLDDYEEGTYTPTVIVDSGTPSYSYQQGYYTKVGRQVFGGGIIGVTNSNTLGGVIRIGLPFTISSGNLGYTGGTVSDGSGFTFPISNGFYNIFLQAANGDSHLAYTGVGTTATTVNYTTSGVGTGWYFRFMFSYYT